MEDEPFTEAGMTHIHPPLTVSVLALFCVTTTATAQTLSLEEAIAEAREHAPESAELDAQVEGSATIARDATRYQRLDPTVTFTFDAGFLGGAQNESTALVGLQWPLDLSGSRRAREGRARSAEDAASLERDAGLLALDEAVAIAHAGLAHAQRRTVRAERILALCEIALAAEEARLAVGQGNQLDRDAAELDAAAARGAVASTHGEVALHQIELGRLLGRVDSSAVVVEDVDESGIGPHEIDLDAAVGADPRVAALEADLRAQELAIQVLRRTGRPIPTLGLEAGFMRRVIPSSAFSNVPAAGTPAWTETELLMTLSSPLGVFDGNREAIARAHAQLEVARARQGVARARVRSELESSWISYRTTVERYEAVRVSASVVRRDLELLEIAVRTGALDGVRRSFAIRRLEEASANVDASARDLRVARAAWRRRVGPMR